MCNKGGQNVQKNSKLPSSSRKERVTYIYGQPLRPKGLLGLASNQECRESRDFGRSPYYSNRWLQAESKHIISAFRVKLYHACIICCGKEGLLLRQYGAVGSCNLHALM